MVTRRARFELELSEYLPYVVGTVSNALSTQKQILSETHKG